MLDSEFEFTQADTFGLTDVGRKRSNNQDQFLIAELSKSMLVSASSLDQFREGRFFGGVQGQILLVADGMGGHAGGEKASSLVLEHLIGRLLNSVHWFFQSETDSEAEFVSSLKSLFRDAHARVLSESQEDQSVAGMGTTLTMAYLHWPKMYVVHAGDSRCYLIRDGVAKQITKDHTLARQMVEAGGMKPEDEATSRWSNVLWNVLGGNSDRELLADVHRVDLQENDSVFLCSDGLYRYFSAEEIAETLMQDQDASVTCKKMVSMANERGGEDNVTVVVSHPTPKRAPGHASPIEDDPARIETAVELETEISPGSDDS
ncbi:MAG: protein phosphatase 2C domain-containing protein [Planctomycetota bacterium]